MTPHDMARMQLLTREECDCGCPVCVRLLGPELLQTDGMPAWYWHGPPPCKGAESLRRLREQTQGPSAHNAVDIGTVGA